MITVIPLIEGCTHMNQNKATSQFELHPDRLATTDDRGRRIYLYPADVRGFFRRRRSQLQAILVLIFLLLPWIKINGHQALLLNVSDRHFEIFGLTLKAHHAPLLFFVLAAAAFGLFTVTSIWGRIWCGWGCPQTVFIDGIYRRIERWIEGSALSRRKLDQEPLSWRKLRLKTTKWSLYSIISLIITHSFLAYFVGTENLREMVTRPPSENWTSFLFILFSTGIILFDFAWFREQFCIIVCPYGRFQSILMDQHSMIVAYDEKRGEPRATPQAKVLAKAHGSQLGDCVNCYRCVQVCPTGIDIRRGLQMECIACTSCIDACDEVMTKVKKPTGLIRYTSQLGLLKQKSKALRSRSIIYASIVGLSLIGLAYNLATMKPVDIAILRAKEAPYTIQSLATGDIIINHLKLELSNQSGSLHQISIELPKEVSDLGVQIVVAISPFPLPNDMLTRYDFFVKFPKSTLIHGSLKIKLNVVDEDVIGQQSTTEQKEVTLVGPL